MSRWVDPDEVREDGSHVFTDEETGGSIRVSPSIAHLVMGVGFSSDGEMRFRGSHPDAPTYLSRRHDHRFLRWRSWFDGWPFYGDPSLLVACLLAASVPLLGVAALLCAVFG